MLIPNLIYKAGGACPLHSRINSFKVKTINGCVGAFCYYARGVARRYVQLYKTKDQMAKLTEDLIVMIEEGGHRVFKLVFDNAGENISDEMLRWRRPTTSC